LEIAVFERNLFAVVVIFSQSSFEHFAEAKMVVVMNLQFAARASLLNFQKATGLAITKNEYDLVNYTLFFLFRAATKCFSDSLAVECSIV